MASVYVEREQRGLYQYCTMKRSGVTFFCGVLVAISLNRGLRYSEGDRLKSLTCSEGSWNV